MIDKVIIINLEKRLKKKQKMILKTKQLHQNYNIEFFKGIDGLDITPSYLKTENIIIKNNWKNPFTNNAITLGEIGCAISHLKIWEIIVNKGYKFTLILEDDIFFDLNFNKKIENYFKQIKDNQIKFDLFYLSRKSFESDLQQYSDNIFKPNFSYWTCGYILSLEGAIKLVNSEYKKNIIPVDEFLPECYLNSKNIFNVKNLNAIVGIPNLIKPEIDAFNNSDTENSIPYIENKTKWKTYKKYKFQIITVATDKTDGYLRFTESCDIYNLPYITLGLNEKWEGLDMSKGPGGGHKINLLKKYLKTIDNDSLILFTDSYDVIINTNIDEIIKKFINLNCKLLFSSEIFCWPDVNLKNKYSKNNNYFKYLNSGGFIGYAKNIKDIILSSNIKNYDDDQLFFTKKFLENDNLENDNLENDNLENNDNNIKLDYNCEIFQTLSGLNINSFDININKSRIFNSITSSNPCIIHGNGGVRSKLLLNYISNYIPLKWRPAYGYYKNSIFDRKILNYPTINIIINKITDMLLIYLNKFNYPKNKIIITLENNIIINNEFTLYKNVLRYNRNDINKIFINNKCDYVLFLCHEHIIHNINTITELILCNKDIVAPMLKRKQSMWSNFWGDIDKNLFYKRSNDYIDILNLKRKGIWNVPYIYGTILIKNNKFNIISKILEKAPNNEDLNEDLDMYFCRILREKNIFMFVCNLKEFGYII